MTLMLDAKMNSFDMMLFVVNSSELFPASFVIARDLFARVVVRLVTLSRDASHFPIVRVRRQRRGRVTRCRTLNVFLDFLLFTTGVVFRQSPRMCAEDMLLYILSVEDLGADKALLLRDFDAVTAFVVNGQRRFCGKHVAALVAFDLELSRDFLRVKFVDVMIAFSGGGKGSAADSTGKLVFAILGNEDARKVRGSVIVIGCGGRGGRIGGGGNG